MTAEYLKAQKTEQEIMQYWFEMITKYPLMFKEMFNKTDLINQCRFKVFIQVRDSELYNKMIELLEK